MKTAAPTTPPVAPAPPAAITPANLKDLPLVPVTSLEQIQALHQEPIGAKIWYYGQLLHFQGRRLTPVEAQEVRHLGERAIPKRKENGEYNLDDPEFLANREMYRRQARAKCVWLAFPNLFAAAAAAAKVELKTVDDITAFVERQNIADEILEELFGVATLSVGSLVEMTGFISGSSSPKS